jgi:heavy metal sensor kinase
MNTTVRTRLTMWYFLVLIVSFALFGWVVDFGFRHSVARTMDDSQQGNLVTAQRVISESLPKGTEKVSHELGELAGIWGDGAILRVTDESGQVIFQSPAFASAEIDTAEASRYASYTTNLNAIQYRISARRASINGNVFNVMVATPTEAFDQSLDQFRLTLKLASPLLIVLASLGGYWLSRRALEPVDEIIQTARGIGGQNLSSRLPVPLPRDELRRLTETLNEMLGRIESNMRRVTQFTADASHELRTPLALLRTTAEVALRRPRREEDYREVLESIVAASGEMTLLLENLLQMARADAGAEALKFRRVDLIRSLRKVKEQAAILAVTKEIRVAADFEEEPVWIDADAAAIERVFLIFIDNAVKYTHPGGSISLRYQKSQDTALVEVCDTGIGVSDKDLPHIFERFYRADPVRSREQGGVGLGLSIANWIVEKHGGAIRVESVPGRGSVFQVHLPFAPRNPASQPLARVGTVSSFRT